MRITLRPATRWPRFTLWAVGFVALWAGLVVAARIVGHYTGTEPKFCLFSRFTTYPSPTCGTTRGVLALAGGDWRAAFAWNPLTLSLGILGVLALAARAATARMLDVQLSSWEKRVLLAVALAIFVLNWLWLIHSQRGGF